MANRLRLHLLRGEWDAIESAEVPSDLSQIERQELTDLLTFYRAVASLQNPKAPLTLAEQRFEALSKRQPHNAAYTAAGNPGERDLLLLQDTTTLVTAEAVVANGSIPHALLTQHFQKLLGYSDCQLYFHITYAWLDGLVDLLASLKRTAQVDAPPGYQFVRLDDLPVVGDQPPGFLATYQVGDRQIEIVFLALDLRQTRMQQAAKTAKTSKPRRPKASHKPVGN